MVEAGIERLELFDLETVAKSMEQAVEIQSQYAKKAYDDWIAEASKLTDMYADMARGAYRPVEQAVARKVS